MSDILKRGGTYPLKGVGKFPNDPKLLIANRGRAFWESEPTGLWAPKAVEALGALAAGFEVVTLSGRNGIGKTMQFLRLLERSLEDYVNQYYEVYHFIKASIEIISPISTVDELGGTARKLGVKATATGLASKVDNTQLVLISPGANKPLRRGVVDSVISRVQEVRPETTVYDMGDVNKAAIIPEYAAAVIKALGGPQDAVELIMQVEALRSVRLFSGMFFDGDPLIFEESLNAETIVDAISYIIQPFDLKHKKISKLAHQAVYQLLPLGEVHNNDLHIFFTGGEFTTEQAIELYKLAGIPLPDPSEFDIEELGFDPYNK